MTNAAGRHKAGALAVLVVLASCSQNRSTAATDTTTRSSTTQTAKPTTTVAPRPATASLSFIGDPAVARSTTEAKVTCRFPGFGGLSISVFVTPMGSEVSYRLFVSQERVQIHVDAGTGPTFVERNFEGPGVSEFDPGTGALLDTSLTETAPTPGIGAGSVGALRRLNGSIDCGDQTPGTSNLTVRGDTSAGRYESAVLDPAVVECYLEEDQITVIGMARTGTQRVLLMISLGPNGTLGAEEVPENMTPHYFQLASGGTTPIPNGGAADGKVEEKNVASPNRLHIEGTVTCGSGQG